MEVNIPAIMTCQPNVEATGFPPGGGVFGGSRPPPPPPSTTGGISPLVGKKIKTYSIFAVKIDI